MFAKCRTDWITAGLLLSAALFCGTAFGEVRWLSSAAEREAADDSSLGEKIAELSQEPTPRHILVQLAALPTAERRAEIDRHGISLLNYAGDRTYFAVTQPDRIDSSFLVNPGLLQDIRSIQRVHKIHPLLQRNETPEWSIIGQTENGELLVVVNLLLQPDVALEETVARLEQRYGATLIDWLASIHACVLALPSANVNALVDDDAVLWIEPPLPMLGPNNDSNRLLVEAAAVNAPPYELDGTGINVLVYDAGTARETHIDFGGRLTRQDTTARNDHSTHVAGTIGGSGEAGGWVYAGMAPGVLLQSYGCEFTGTTSFFYMNSGDIEADYDEAINVLGVDIANNSVGSNVAKNHLPCAWEGNYGATSALIDAIVCGSLGTPFRVVWSNGNERAYGTCGSDYYTIAPPSGAKNHISVGAVNSNDDTITYFSSWGPTDDGRIKPDVVAPGCEQDPQPSHECGVLIPESDPGCGVKSCGAADDQAYVILCGASMAAPTVTGSLALLMQDFRAQFPERPWPRNSTLKILLAQTAMDLGNPGPDYQHGYGSIRIKQAIDFMRLDQFIERQIEQGETYILYVAVDPGDQELKITIAWDDPPGIPNVAPNLVNDLDMRVYGPNDQAPFPWTLDPGDPEANSSQDKADHVNNIEQVLVANPQPGYWRVEIVGYAVPQGPQIFSLCSSHPIQPYFATEVISRTWTVCNSASGDLDCDCLVDLADLAQLLAHWSDTDTAFFEGDTDLDGDVDLRDLAELLGHYQQSCE